MRTGPAKAGHDGTKRFARRRKPDTDVRSALGGACAARAIPDSNVPPDIPAADGPIFRPPIGRSLDKPAPMHELRHALRGFVRTPGATGLVVATLAIAMAAAIVIASTIDMVWHFIPVVRIDRLAFVASTDPSTASCRFPSASARGRLASGWPAGLHRCRTAARGHRTTCYLYSSAESDAGGSVDGDTGRLGLRRNPSVPSFSCFFRRDVERLPGTRLIVRPRQSHASELMFLSQKNALKLVRASLWCGAASPMNIGLTTLYLRRRRKSKGQAAV